MSRYHHHHEHSVRGRKVDSDHGDLYDSKKVLIETGPGEVIPYETGVITRWHFSAAWFALILVWAATVGALVWLIIEFARERPYFCENATLTEEDDGAYIMFQGLAAEPYSGRPDKVLSKVKSVTECFDECTNSECGFFTHNVDQKQCYLYNQGVLPDQNLKAATPGPSSLDTNVYVKKYGRAVELRGILKSGV